MKRRKPRQARKGRIEIIPMIDVMFFLLATFMIASLSMQKLDSIHVNLPKGKAERLQANHPVTLTLTNDSKIFVNRRPVTLQTLAAALKPLIHDTQQNLIVAADALTPQGLVVQAMLKAQSAGVKHFLIGVKHE